MSSLLEAGLIEVNARGHYRVPPTPQPDCTSEASARPSPSASNKSQAKIVGEDYFPASNVPKIIAGDYFPTE